MSRICHEHCPTGEGSGWFWFTVMVGATGSAVWLLGELLTGLGKTTMTIIVGAALVAVIVILVIAVRTAVRNSTGDAATTTEAAAVRANATGSHPVAEDVTNTDTDAAWTDEPPAGQAVSPRRRQLRLIRGGRAA